MVAPCCHNRRMQMRRCSRMLSEESAVSASHPPTRKENGFQRKSHVFRSDVIARAAELGVQVKMISGDHVAIAKETCRVIGMGTQILTTKDIPTSEAETLSDRFGELVESCDGFEGVHPEHKFQIVEVLKNRGWLTGMTGNGVNDAPSLKKANVCIAVEAATDAAQGASAIVLTSPGLPVIVEAIDLAWKIFQSMKNYIIYRIAYTVHLLVFFLSTT